MRTGGLALPRHDQFSFSGECKRAQLTSFHYTAQGFHTISTDRILFTMVCALCFHNLLKADRFNVKIMVLITFIFKLLQKKITWRVLRWLLPPAHTLDGSAAKISMQDFLMIYKEKKGVPGCLVLSIHRLFTGAIAFCNQIHSDGTINW